MAAGRSSTGISPRPMLMGAPRNALRAFNAGVSLSCLRILAHRLPHLFYGSVLSLTCLVGVPSCGLATGSWRTGRPAPHRQIVSVCLMLRRRPPAGLSLSRNNRLCRPVTVHRFRCAVTERQIAHNGKRGKGTRSPHGLKDYPT